MADSPEMINVFAVFMVPTLSRCHALAPSFPQAAFSCVSGRSAVVCPVRLPLVIPGLAPQHACGFAGAGTSAPLRACEIALEVVFMWAMVLTRIDRPSYGTSEGFVLKTRGGDASARALRGCRAFARSPS